MGNSRPKFLKSSAIGAIGITIAVVLGLQLLSWTAKQKEISYFDTRPNINCQKLKEGFDNVPQEAKMRAWWFWMSGIATRKSITQDLKAMKANGIAGAILCDNGGNYSPPGVVFMSDEWKDNFAHAIKEADRFGIEISLNIQSGCGDPGKRWHQSRHKRPTYPQNQTVGYHRFRKG